MNEMKAFTEDGQEFFDSYVATYFIEQFPDNEESIERCKDWTMSNSKWRMFYVVFDLMQDKQLMYNVDENNTILDKVTLVFKSILIGNKEAKNYNVKSIVLNQLFKILV